VTVDAVSEKTTELITAIRLLVDSHHAAPALILAYSTMDAMAWLNRPASHDDVTRSDFVDWVDKYLLPGSCLPCTSMDLYSARCALLHSYAAESRLTREGQAREVFYAWGSARAPDLQETIANEGSRNAVALQVEELVKSLSDAVERFIASPDDPELVESRALKLFTGISPTT